MRRSSVFADRARIASGVCARANNRLDAATVVVSLVRRLRMHEIRVRNGSRCCTAMKLTIGAFHFGASRLSTARARLTERESSGARAEATPRAVSVFLRDATGRSLEPIYHAQPILSYLRRMVSSLI